MALVSNIRKVAKTAPFSNSKYTACYYNGYIYINTKTHIYRYDPINNLYTTLINKGVTSSYGAFAVGEVMYILQWDSTYSTESKNHVYIGTFNMSSETYVESVSNVVNNITYPGQNNEVTSFAYQDGNIYVGNYGYAGVGAGWNSAYNMFSYDFNGTLTRVRGSGDTVYYGGNPVVYAPTTNYYFGGLVRYTYNPTPVSKSLGWGTVGTGANLYSRTSKGTPDDYYTAGFYSEEDGYIYIFGEKNISRYNALDDSFLLINENSEAIFGNFVKSEGVYYGFSSESVFIVEFIDYNLTFKIANNSGDVIYTELTGQTPTTSVTFNEVSGENNIGYVFNTLVGTVSGNYTPQIPDGKKLIGFSMSPKSSRIQFALNKTSDIVIDGDVTFYEVYGTYRPPETTFDIHLYQNSAEVNRVDKSNYLVGVGTLSGALREECSMLTPSIVYQSSDVPTFNYVYIPIFNRYYYVTSLSSVSKNVWRMELNCDVLMTYKNEIFLLQGVIGRQEIDFNPLLVDNELPTQNNPIVEVIDIPSDAFNTQTSDAGHNYVITVIGA